uniref:Epimerase family protein SDR39U1-like protein, chloroplastic n=1 Tax=Auxenochlorella protothecoides TaxID=3075 RepID=A0A1D1ZZ05_AUXPR
MPTAWSRAQSTACRIPHSLTPRHRSSGPRNFHGRRIVVVNCQAGQSVAVAGATGLIGSGLVPRLQEEGYEVRVLTRDAPTARDKLSRIRGLRFAEPPEWSAAVAGTAGVINLAGEPIATRWSPTVKAEVKRSRLQTTNRLVAIMNGLPEAQRPPAFISASAVGYYGTSERATFNEQSGGGTDFLAEVCKEWESAAQRANTRVVILRNGIVLSKEGGALGRMIPMFSLFAGGPLGSGQQWCSWIHRDDVVGILMAALKDEQWSGVYNATAPSPVRMGQLCSELGAAMGRPALLPVPDFAIRLLLGEGATVVLDGQRVLPLRAQEAGYDFKFSQVGDALRQIMS